MENERELNAADRYLMWKLRSKAANIVEDRMPDDRAWWWRTKEPPTIIEPSAGDISESEMMIETSSLGELASKGMLWRGLVAGLTRDAFRHGYGWGFTEKGLRTLKEILKSDEPEQWRRAQAFWRELFAA